MVHSNFCGRITRRYRPKQRVILSERSFPITKPFFDQHSNLHGVPCIRPSAFSVPSHQGTVCDTASDAALSWPAELTVLIEK